MNTLLYLFASGLVLIIRLLPLNLVARIGRFSGGLFYHLDARHRRVARRNLAMCFPEKSPTEIRSLARENFRRIGENFLCPIKMVHMDAGRRAERVEVAGGEKMRANLDGPRRSIIMAIGHFGNFELLAHLAQEAPGYRFATTYRAIRNPAADQLLQKLRNATGCLYFERRSDGAALREALGRNNIVLGLLSDQHSGDHGLRIPFLGHDCNTSKAPAVFAQRYEAPLFTAIVYRTSLAHWRVEVGDEIPTTENGEARSRIAIMRDVNQAFEKAVRRDPANWFWVHNRWKKSKLKTPATSTDEEQLALQ